MDRYLKTIFTILAVSMMVVGTMAPAMAVSSKAYSFEDNLEVALPNVAYELPYVPGEILVKFNTGVSEAKMNAMNSKNGATVIATSSYTNLKKIKIPKTKSVEEMVNVYKKNSDVEYASANYVMYAAMLPNDPLYNYQWNFNNSTTGINVEPAWDLSDGSGVIVAVLDTGVLYSDIYDSNVFYDLEDTTFVQGHDYINNDDDPADDNGHGTHVTGTIAQSTNNNKGVAGIAYNCSIMPIKILDKRGSGDIYQLIEGIKYATTEGADIITMSLGFPPTFDSESGAGIELKNAIDDAYAAGITITAAAGNGATGTVNYPAAYVNCIAVGATSYDGDLAYYSNWGTAIDVVAPGGDMKENLFIPSDTYYDGILQSTFERNPRYLNYYFFQGTSMATPHVAGVAALVISHYEKENGVKPSPAQVREAIEYTASNGPDGWNSVYGYGLIDAEAALNYKSSSTTPTNTPPDADAGGTYSGTVGNAVTFDGSGSYDSDGTIVSYSWDFGDGATESGVSPTHPYAATGTFTVTLTVEDNGGLTNQDTAIVTISEPSTDSTMYATVICPPASQVNRIMYEATAIVTIVNETGGPVEGAIVYGDFTIPSGILSVSGVTDGNGKVEISSGNYKASTDAVTFTVTDVTHSDYIYESDIAQ
ncbi:S8 family serine peptidase [Methanolobus sp. WCC4]|uniref:S8 family serine peptidase n=1 Tax=Methanolobus sp. WCC4 TaxID=3125784 RepID=UPI0030FA1261